MFIKFHQLLFIYWTFDNRSKAPDKKPPGQKPPAKKPSGQKPPDNKPPRIIEEIIAKYAVDANLFRLGSTNPKKKIPDPGFSLVGGEAPNQKKRLHFFFG